MKKIFYCFCLPISFISAYVFAGGPDQMVPAPTVVPYIDIMGGGCWRDFNGPDNFTELTDVAVEEHVFSTNSDDWMIRGALGLKHPFNSTVSLTSEIGWGWYGQDRIYETNTITPIVTGPTVVEITRNTFNYNGFDLLVGGVYNLTPKISFFGKLGGLILNQKLKEESVSGATSPLDNESDRTEVLPDLLIGAMYNINPMFGVGFDYMHAFGDSCLPLGVNKVVGTTVVFTHRNHNLPTINALMASLEVRFPVV